MVVRLLNMMNHPLATHPQFYNRLRLRLPPQFPPNLPQRVKST